MDREATYPNRQRMRLREIDSLRCLSMLAVMTIHVTSTYIYEESQFLVLGMNLAYVLNQAARFSVPMFLLLSGYSLGLRTEEMKYRVYLKRKASQLLLPHFIWTIIYAVVGADFNVSVLTAWCREPLQILRLFLTGQAAPHLYFIPILFQFYLLYPLLARLVRSSPLQTAAWALSISFALQTWYALRELGWLQLNPPQDFWLAFPLWLFYFVAGIYLQQVEIDKLRDLCHSNTLPLLIFTTSLFFLCGVYSLLTGNIDSIRPELLLYTPSVFFCSIALVRGYKKENLLDKLIGFLAGRSMEFYYCHVLVLIYLRRTALFQAGTWGMLLVLSLTAVISMVFAIFLHRMKKLTIWFRSGRILTI